MIDKQGREIAIVFQNDPISIVAYDGRNEIGTMEFEEQTNAAIKLKYLNVEPTYLRCGIGRGMLIEALSHLHSFELPKPVSQRSADDGDFLTNDAELFFQSCERNGDCNLNGRTVARS